MSRLIVRNGVFSRGPFRGALGEDPAPATDATVLRAISDRTTTIIKKLDDQERTRNWALIIGGTSAVFAAVKLGLITWHIKRSGRSDGGWY